MENKENKEELIEKLSNVHYSAGPIYKQAKRRKAHDCMKTNELHAIFHLVESHVPSLRMKTVLRYEKILTSASENIQLSLSKKHVSSGCMDNKIDDEVNKMLQKIKEMPSEWTLVQLTPHFNPKENTKIDINEHYTNSLYLTVFNCGENQAKPFCVNVEAPRDSITGLVIPLCDEVYSIMNENKSTLLSSRKQTHFKGISEKQNYYEKRQSIDGRLKMLVKELQDLYLREWKCFMVGKYIDRGLENKIGKHIKQFFKTEAPSFQLDKKTQSIVQYLIKAANYLKLTELKRAVQSIIPGSSNKELQKLLLEFIRNTSNELALPERKRHPIILIIDDSLDSFPWEMMDILVDVPVSRLPSLHLAYALFQEHKDTIENGFKIIKNPGNGTYIVNPDSDLRNMQNRILSFYEYWLPSWTGVSGGKPTEDQFEQMLVSGEIFAYNGHGSGSHHFPLHKIERLRISAIALLFGCCSTKLNIIGPQSEMYSTYQMYLIACSPCIVGNLWEVTDLDTDILATEFLSLWIPNTNTVHWSNVEKSQWRRGERVNFKVECKSRVNNQLHEPELLKALCIAKKSNLLGFYITRAAIVARGIPVKIDTN